MKKREKANPDSRWLLGCPVGKNLPRNAGDTGSILSPEIPYAVGHPSLCTRSTEPTL